MAGHIWFADAQRKSQLSCGAHVLGREQYAGPDYTKALSAMEQHGVVPSADAIPQTCFWPYRDGALKPPKSGLFLAGGHVAVTADCAEVMRSFDLGDGGFRPIELRQNDGTTRVAGDYFLLIFGARKRALVTVSSPGAPDMYAPDLWSLRPDLRHGEVAVSATALDGPDLWVDPTLSRGFFLSGRLADTLREARLSRGFYLKRCAIVR